MAALSTLEQPTAKVKIAINENKQCFRIITEHKIKKRHGLLKVSPPCNCTKHNFFTSGYGSDSK